MLKDQEDSKAGASSSPEDKRLRVGVHVLLTGGEVPILLMLVLVSSQE